MRVPSDNFNYSLDCAPKLILVVLYMSLVSNVPFSAYEGKVRSKVRTLSCTSTHYFSSSATCDNLMQCNNFK